MQQQIESNLPPIELCSAHTPASAENPVVGKAHREMMDIGALPKPKRVASRRAATARNEIELRVDGHHFTVTPLPDCLGPLITHRLTVANPDSGSMAITPIEMPLTLGLSNSFPSGLLHIVDYVLRSHGFRCRILGVTATADVTMPDPCGGALSRDTYFPVMNFIALDSRGLIRFDGGQVDPITLARQLALAFDKDRIAFVSESRTLNERLAASMAKIGRPIPIVESTSVEFKESPKCFIATFTGLANPSLESHFVNLTFVLDAVQALGGRVANYLLAPDFRSRLFGLVNTRQKLSRFERDKLSAIFGFHEYFLPKMNFVERPVAVIRLPSRDGVDRPRPARPQPAIPDAEGRWLAELRDHVWHNPIRNRRIAKLARLLVEGDWSRLERQFPETKSLERRIPPGAVVVLTGSVEHANELARSLPCWPVIQRGLPGPTRPELWGADVSTLVKTGLIATVAGSDEINLNAVGTLIRADGGRDIAEGFLAKLVVPPVGAQPLLLIDFDDLFRPALRLRSRSRFEMYEARGWPINGIDPIVTRSMRFVQARPTLLKEGKR